MTEGPTKTTVSNIRSSRWSDHIGRDQVLIDRRTKWGNPFRIGIDGSREDVIAMYREWLLAQPQLLAQLPLLKGKVLLCWCKPLACHGDVLVELVEARP